MSEAMDVSEDTGSSSSRVVGGGSGPSIRVVLPGDDLTTYLTELHAGSSQPLKVSHGISSIISPASSSSSSSTASENSEQIQLIATLPGQLMMSQGNKNRNNPSLGNHYVECSRRRYYPRQGDQVVGIIEERGGDFYTVNIFSGRHCLLNRLAFEGATKRNRPELKRGDLVYARVVLADIQRDTELSCVNTNGVKKDWSSGETIYGPLPQGLLINVATGFAKRLLRPDCVVLNSLSKHFAYEISIGMNGAVWMRCEGSPLDLIIIRNAIINSEYLDDIQTEAMVDKLIEMANKAGRKKHNN